MLVRKTPSQAEGSLCIGGPSTHDNRSMVEHRTQYTTGHAQVPVAPQLKHTSVKCQSLEMMTSCLLGVQWLWQLVPFSILGVCYRQDQMSLMVLKSECQSGSQGCTAWPCGSVTSSILNSETAGTQQDSASTSGMPSALLELMSRRKARTLWATGMMARRSRTDAGFGAGACTAWLELQVGPRQNSP